MNNLTLLNVITLSLSLMPCLDCNGQSQYKRFGEGEAVSFKTKMGEWTAFHVGMSFNPSHISKQLDIQFRYSPSDDPSRLSIGDGPPNYFIDRRGTWHQIKLDKDEPHRWIASNIRFYPGESGSPVFSRSGRVVGIVLGNLLDAHTNKWKGRISKISEFVRQVPSSVPQTKNRTTFPSDTVSVEGVFE